jgi:hypothetical protein
MAQTTMRSKVAVTLVGATLLMLAAHLLFGSFFPSAAGLGHDYAGGFPAMLAEYYWSLMEGPWAAPWFTPAFCGGVPVFADPGSMYYAFPSIFVRFAQLDPLAATYATFLMFAGIGFLGAYVFGRDALKLSWQAALLGAVIFGLNGFYVHRMLVGHLGFHGVMLVPWLAYVAATGPDRWSWKDHTNLARCLAGGLILGYWVHAGAQSLMPAFGLASAALVNVAWLRGSPVRPAIMRATVMLGLGFALAASKLAATFSFMAEFTRSGYRLPGFGSLLDSLNLAVLTLFGNLPDIAEFASLRLENTQWRLDRQEFEYGVTLVPIVLILVAIALFLSRDRAEIADEDRRSKRILGGLLAVILTLPLALNTYSPAWNEVLKSLPLIGSSSSMLRWFVIYVPLAAIGAGIAVDAISKVSDMRSRLSILSLIAFFGLTASVDRQYYASQNYDPTPVVAAFDSAASTADVKPQINSIGAFVDNNGAIALAMNRNDIMTLGSSQLACYMPIFGYRLENFPFKSLHLGSVWDVTNGELNIKNPACFVFPKENNCSAGDHFQESRRADAEKFVSYRSFNFEKSSKQKIADIVSGIALLATLLAGLFVIARWSISLRRKATGE